MFAGTNPGQGLQAGVVVGGARVHLIRSRVRGQAISFQTVSLPALHQLQAQLNYQDREFLGPAPQHPIHTFPECFFSLLHLPATPPPRKDLGPT